MARGRPVKDATASTVVASLMLERLTGLAHFVTDQHTRLGSAEMQYFIPLNPRHGPRRIKHLM